METIELAHGHTRTALRAGDVLVHSVRGLQRGALQASEQAIGFRKWHDEPAAAFFAAAPPDTDAAFVTRHGGRCFETGHLDLSFCIDDPNIVLSHGNALCLSAKATSFTTWATT